MTAENWARLSAVAGRMGCMSWRMLIRKIATGEIQVVASVAPVVVPRGTERPVILQPVDTITDKGAERHWVPIED